MEDFDYDKEKYRDTLKEAAETVLGSLGFDEVLTGTSQKRTIESGGMSLGTSEPET